MRDPAGVVWAALAARSPLALLSLVSATAEVSPLSRCLLDTLRRLSLGWLRLSPRLDGSNATVSWGRLRCQRQLAGRLRQRERVTELGVSSSRRGSRFAIWFLGRYHGLSSSPCAVKGSVSGASMAYLGGCCLAVPGDGVSPGSSNPRPAILSWQLFIELEVPPPHMSPSPSASRAGTWMTLAPFFLLFSFSNENPFEGSTESRSSLSIFSPPCPLRNGATDG